MNELRNDGVFLINGDRLPEADGTATIIVVGVSRSGTTMVAACLRAFGVFMGNEEKASAVQEDVEMATAIESGDKSRLAELIEARNAEYPVWGFKRPMAFRVIARHLAAFRNPRLVVTFRDPVAIAKRNQISMHMDFVRALRMANEQTAELIDFVGSIGVPAMLVSYEKALFEPTGFVARLAAFCGIEANPVLTQKAVASVENGPEDYLDSSRIRPEGHLDRVVDGHAYGWAYQPGQKQPCTVAISRQGKVIGRGKADLFRPDLAKAGKARGYCAFKIALDDPAARKAGVTARIVGKNFVLKK